MAPTKGRRPSKRGFAGMDEEKKREIAAKGGHSVPPEERSFSKDHELASEAGSKGGGRPVTRATRTADRASGAAGT